MKPGLAHLLLWTTGCAVYFSIARLFLPNLPRTLSQTLVLCLVALYAGLCWTGGLDTCWRVLNHRMTPPDPGGWLLFALAAVLALDLLILIIPDTSLLRPEALQIGGTCLAFALPTLSRRLPVCWRLFFAAVSILAAGQLVWLMANLTLDVTMTAPTIDGYGIVRSVVGLQFLVLAIGWDRRPFRSYGWLHGLGVLCTVIWLLLCLSRA